MKWIRNTLLITALSLSPLIAAKAQSNQEVKTISVSDFTYADFVDITLMSPIIASVEVTRAKKLSAKLAPDLQEGKTRFYIEAKVSSLIRGADGLAGNISYLLDVPNDEKGHAKRIPEKTRFLIFGQPVSGHPDQIMLTRPDSNLDWDPKSEAVVSGITREILSNSPAPQITSITSAFYVPGSVPGESETQIFLQTISKQPISLNILRRPQEKPQWAVALGEMTDEAATPPAPNSLLWYRLACGLPRNIPQSVLSTLSAHDMIAVADDYKVVLAGLGACGRNHHFK
ncbi:MAG: hypothetical protein ABF675_06775 [Zymomonas mobilis]|uniref:hypothetical protein n=1 Tax=Zymomonas mobilis TaxID=542 RepID=UPI0039E895E3